MESITEETVIPNVVVEWLTLLFHIREVLGSNLGPDWVFHSFPQSFWANAGIVP